MGPDFHHLQILPEDVESCLIFGNLVFLAIDVGIVSNHGVNKTVGSSNHKMSGLVFCSKNKNSRVPLDGVDIHCIVQHLPCCRILHHSLCRDGEGNEDEGDGRDDALHNDIGLDDGNNNNCDDTDGNLNDTCNHSFLLLLICTIFSGFFNFYPGFI